MIDIHVIPGVTGGPITEAIEVKHGFDGRRGPPGLDARSAGVLSYQGTPEAALNLGPWYPPGEQSFTDENSICGCLVAPASDWIATIWRNTTLVGSATILAGETVGIVEFFGGGFDVARPQFVNGVCPAIADPAIQNPSISLG